MAMPSPAVLPPLGVAEGAPERDAIGVVQDTVIGMASSAPAASVALTLAALAAATKQRRTNPGKAAVLAVALLGLIYTLSIVGLQGVVSPAKHQANSGSALVLGILPLAAAGFLGWILEKSLWSAPSAQIWSLVRVLIVGVVLMISARFVQRSTFFSLPREQYSGEPGVDAASALPRIDGGGTNR